MKRVNLIQLNIELVDGGNKGFLPIFLIKALTSKLLKQYIGPRRNKLAGAKARCAFLYKYYVDIPISSMIFGRAGLSSWKRVVSTVIS